MKKNNIKFILLILLSCFMIYIWWGIFNSFSKTESKQNQTTNNKNDPITSKIKQKIEFKKPKLNPFKKYSNKQVSKPQTKQNKKQPIQTTPKLSSLFILQGIISEKNNSQAIITQLDGNSSIVSIHEKIREWELIQIDNNLIIFKIDTLYDTLKLQTIK